jgi:hypothetical protein
MSGKKILVVSRGCDAGSTRTLKQLLASMGRTRVVADSRLPSVLGGTRYDFVVINNGTTRRVLSLLGDLKRRMGRAAVVVVKSNVSWQDARKLLLAGAADVITDPWATTSGVSNLEASLRVLSQA